MKKLFLSLALATSLLAGCGDSTNLIAPLPNTVNQPGSPVAVDDNFIGLGNATTQFAAGAIFANDTRNGANILAFDRSSANGGTVVVNLDGSFNYTAPTGFTGTDSFSYSLQNTFGTSTATVFVQVNQTARFVNNTATGGDGSQGAPFSDLASAIAAAGPNDIIFIFAGNGASVGGGVTLQNGQQLIGEGVGLTINGNQVVAAGASPVVNGSITLADGNTISGFALQNAAGNSIIGNGFTGSTISNNQFSNVGSDGINILNFAGTNTISNNTFVGLNNEGIEAVTNVDATINITNNTFNDDASSDPVTAIGVGNVAGNLTANVSGNTSEPAAVAGAYDTGILINNAGTGNLTYVGANNTFRNTSFTTIRTINGGTGLLSTSHTNLTTSGGTGVSFSANEGDGDKQHLITNSNLATAAAVPTDIAFQTNTNADGVIAVRNTTLGGQGLLFQNSTGTTCIDLEQVTAAAIITLEAAGTLQIEEAATAGTRNTVTTLVLDANADDVADGTCGI